MDTRKVVAQEVDEESGETIILRATFDRALIPYSLAMFCLIMTVSFLFPLIPFLLPCMYYAMKKNYESRKLKLQSGSLVYEAGFYGCFCVCWNHRSKIIPLEKITDLEFQQGCLERQYGIASLLVQTAGSSNPNGGPELTLQGVTNAKEFRAAVLRAKRAFIHNHGGATAATGEIALATPASCADTQPLLEVRDVLVRIENQVNRVATLYEANQAAAAR